MRNSEYCRYILGAYQLNAIEPGCQDDSKRASQAHCQRRRELPWQRTVGLRGYLTPYKDRLLLWFVMDSPDRAHYLVVPAPVGTTGALNT